jgi:hypothetical protein
MGQGIVFSIQRPGPIWNRIDIFKLPVAQVNSGHPQVLTHRRTHVQACIVITVRAWALAAEDILPVVNLERSHIFPLSVADTPTMPDRYPAALADGLAVANERIPEPWIT